jgi:hypothetical protein
MRHGCQGDERAKEYGMQSLLFHGLFLFYKIYKVPGAFQSTDTCKIIAMSSVGMSKTPGNTLSILGRDLPEQS